jgi:uncharacterized protein involved in response to NO
VTFNPLRIAATAPLWRLGFRPFYLLSSLFAALSIAIWSMQYTGVLPVSYLAGPLWHAHEMVFGYALGVISGFLLTAVRNWTQKDTPTGVALMALAALWVAGRVLALTPSGWAGAAIDAAFPLAVAVGIGRPLVQSGNHRNYFFIVVLVLLGVAAAATQLSLAGALSLPAWAGVHLGLDLVLFVIAVIAGRVVPMFTNNGVAGAGAQRFVWLERLSLGSVIAIAIVDAAQLHGPVFIALLALAAAAHAGRWAMWKPWRTLRNPLVWVLHLGYAWVPVHLAMRGLAEAGTIASPLATHALTAGAIGGLTLGMMTRTARGHTGRMLEADAYEITSYLLVFSAACVRVFLPLAIAGTYLGAVFVSGALWSAAFALHTVRYWPVLTQARVDGKPG